VREVQSRGRDSGGDQQAGGELSRLLAKSSQSPPARRWIISAGECVHDSDCRLILIIKKTD
jgi:hypothetical protein